MAVLVNATKLFKTQILSTGIDYQEWIIEFSDWKSGSPDSIYLFGRDFKNQGSENLYHVHVLPSSEEDPRTINRWRTIFNNSGPAHKRTSDNLLFYSYSKKIWLFTNCHSNQSKWTPSIFTN
jgi:hypothetical protein